MLSAVFGFIGIQELVRHVVFKENFQIKWISKKAFFYIENPQDIP